MAEDTQCDYKILEQLGHGSYGLVNKVKKDDAEETAMKIIQADSDNFKYGLSSILECDIMSRLRHPNLVSSLIIYNNENCEDLKEQDLAIVMPLYVTSFDKILLNLDHYTAISLFLKPDEYDYEIKKNKVLPDINWLTMLNLCHDLANGLFFLHQNNMLHLDIKLENCLISDYRNPRAALADFGLSIYSDNINEVLTRQLKITSAYRPPELLQLQMKSKNATYTYNTKSDVWSLGIVYYYILTRKYPTLPNYEVNTIYKDIQSKFNEKNIDDHLEIVLAHIPETYQHDIVTLLKGMLQFDPSKRYTVDQILHAKIFKRYQHNTQGAVREPKLLDIPVWLDVYDEGLDILIKYMKDTHPHMSYRLLFLTIDLYYRAIPYYQTQLEEEEIKDALIVVIVATCIMLSTKIYQVDKKIKEIIDALPIDVDVSIILENEKLLIIKLLYIINRTLYSDWFVSKEHLIDFYKEKIFLTKDYINFNYSEWIKKHGIGKTQIPINYSISDYFNDI